MSASEKSDNGRSVIGCVRIRMNSGVTPQERLHDLALNPDATPVNDPDLNKPLLAGLVKILLDDAGNFRRPKGVQIDPVLDRQNHRVFHIIW